MWTFALVLSIMMNTRIKFFCEWGALDIFIYNIITFRNSRFLFCYKHALLLFLSVLIIGWIVCFLFSSWLISIIPKISGVVCISDCMYKFYVLFFLRNFQIKHRFCQNKLKWKVRIKKSKLNFKFQIELIWSLVIICFLFCSEETERLSV